MSNNKREELFKEMAWVENAGYPIEDNANLTQDAFDRARSVIVDMKSNPAATSWLKYTANKESIFDPQVGEWCLWSMIHDGDRNYFSGKLFNSGGLLMLDWDGFRPVYPNDTLYYARVNKKIAFLMSKEEFERKYRGQFDD